MQRYYYGFLRIGVLRVGLYLRFTWSLRVWGYAVCIALWRACIALKRFALRSSVVVCCQCRTPSLFRVMASSSASATDRSLHRDNSALSLLTTSSLEALFELRISISSVCRCCSCFHRRCSPKMVPPDTSKPFQPKTSTCPRWSSRTETRSCCRR